MNDQNNKPNIAGEADVTYGLQCFAQKKYEEGFQAFMKAALKGHPGAMNNVALCFYNGQGTAEDKEASFVWMKKAAEGGYIPAYFILALKYLKGDGTKQSMPDAIQWARRAAEDGNKHQEPAKQLLAKLEEAIQKSPIVQTRQMAMNEVNKGIEFLKEQKFEEAFKCFLNAALAGDLNAMNNLSLCYASGQGVEQSDEKSFQWMKRAAEGGLVSSFYAMADKYLNGRGPEKSLDMAEYWAKKAVEFKNPFTPGAQILLNIIAHEKSFAPEVREALEKGNELWNKKEYEAALEQLEIAGRAGHAAALRLIGFAYLKGLGLKADPAKAYQFLEAAVYRGDQYALVLIIRTFNGVNKVALWQAYAKQIGLEGADKIFDLTIANEQKTKRVYSSALNALTAMEQAATYWKNTEENPAAANNASAPAMMARPGFEKAMHYGNLDAVCGLASVFEAIDDPRFKEVYVDMYRIAAYMGHSYAMYRTAQHYEEKAPEIAKICFELAKKWGYPAVDVSEEKENE